MRVLVTGGAGFVGSHLCAALLARGDEVVAMDNFATSTRVTVDRLAGNRRFSFIEADVCAAAPVLGTVDAIAHLACPASPDEYLRLPLETLAIGSHGSEYVLGLAKKHGCRVLLASTSEVYGDPLESPQREEYWGLNTGIVRIFNTYGPGLRPDDGRVVSNLVAQALRGDTLTIYGDGRQTRSFCYVSDLVDGLVRMLGSREAGPINLGNPNEISILELAETVLSLTGSNSALGFRPIPQDDPTTRRPDITKAAALLGWSPTVQLADGLSRTITWQRSLAAVPA
jgi:dTDP-glucose 4,6-dehydratase